MSARVDDTLANEYGKRYGNPTRGTTIAVESFFCLKVRIFSGIKGIFSESEIAAITDCCNGIARQPEFMYKNALLLQLDDSEKLTSLSSRFSFNLDELKEKIVKLHESEVFFLLDRIYQFWEAEADKESSFEALIKDFE